MPTVPKAKPFDDFVSQSLKDFKQHLQAERMTANTITERMKGATEFARFLVGRPHRFGEISKGDRHWEEDDNSRSRRGCESSNLVSSPSRSRYDELHDRYHTLLSTKAGTRYERLEAVGPGNGTRSAILASVMNVEGWKRYADG
jgi:hypothetical protein